MEAFRLRIVETYEDVIENFHSFNRDIRDFDQKKMNEFKAWYHEPDLGLFAPSKFIKYKNMNVARYYKPPDDEYFNGGVKGLNNKGWFSEEIRKKQKPYQYEELKDKLMNFHYENRFEFTERKDLRFYISNPSLEANVDSPVITETEKEIITKSRIGQSRFKEQLLKIKSECKICSISDSRFLIASHIKPWSKSNSEERLDISNGLLLCPNHDSLFDRGFITFNNEGVIILSKSLDVTTCIFMNIHEDIRIELTDKQKKYMAWHRKFYNNNFS